MKLPPVVTVNKQAQGTFKGVGTARETSGGSCQASQVVSQLGVVTFHRIGIGFTFGNFITTIVIPQAIVSIKSIAEILFGLWCFVDHPLNILLCALPDHFATQVAACLAVYDRDDVNPVFSLPIKVNNSSISAVLTSLGTGASGKLAALALTHNDTVRWWIPRWRPIRRKFMPSTYSCSACFRTSSG